MSVLINQQEDLKQCIDYLKTITYIGVDIETQRKHPKGTYDEEVYKAGLDPYLSKILMLQLGDENEQYVIDCRKVDIAELKVIFKDLTKTFVGVNLKFEAKHLKHNYGIIFHNIWDCMLVDKILTNGMDLGYSLAKMAERYLDIKSSESIDLFEEYTEGTDYIDKSIRTQFIEWEDKPFTQSQINYGANDILVPLKIMKLQKSCEYYPTKCIEIENKFCLVLADIELQGLPFDQKQWLKVAAEKRIIYNSRLERLDKYVIRTAPKFSTPPTLFGDPSKCNILWSSSDQVIKYFRFLKFCPKEKSKQTKRMEYSVSSKALQKLLNIEFKERLSKGIETEISDEKTLILNYLLFKQSEQAITTFGNDFLKYVHPITNKIHSNYTQIITTGRMASSKPNVQNIPSEIGYRMAFIPKEGNTHINCDYASQESRLLAEVCGDKEMLDFFNVGHDIFKDDYHSFIATKMFRIIRNEPNLIITKDTHPKERQDAKSINFKISYGGSAYTLKDDFGVTEEVAQKFIDGFFEAIPSLKADFEQAKASVLEKGYIDIDNITGRRWWWKEFTYLSDLNEKIWSYYPNDYKTLSKENKLLAKAEVYKKNPNVKDLWSEYFSIKGKAERNALNYRVQGLAGSQTKLAGIYFREYQLKNKLENKIFLTNLIHDEALAEVQLGFEEEGRQIIEDCMIKGAQYFCKQVKMEAEAVITPFWHH